MNDTLDLACALMARPSVTPDDAGCQSLLAERMAALGFAAEWFVCGDVTNVLITHGAESPSLWFLGHTDVVPPGPESDWTSPPFAPEVRDGVLYGRGACDMKGAVAAMVVALEDFVREHPDHPGQVGLLLTSDEEGDAQRGIREVAGILAARGQVPDHCLVGEPSSQRQLGDTVRIGRRGSIVGVLTVKGVQGHTAFPESIDNPVHRLAPFLAALVERRWDDGVDDADGQFPPTHCQVSNINAGTGASNVTPGAATLTISFRYNTHWNADTLHQAVQDMLADAGVENYTLDWRVSGEPFRSPAGALRRAVADAVPTELGLAPALNTGGGTSDGRFIAPLGTEVVELGLLNASIHKVDEYTPVADLDDLSRVYRRVMKTMFTAGD
ncbi:succinyl-diaminopimelate desuccinylase [Marinihelvus fidelis]|uniref:Succinyl-diaminopimelate desuccinylase n=1 Tax=Marinihelvus fidelis TaxID=2613842 RepID=A0A5N0THJ0_9GAMM|nr:succinyl-diaminopimelate desuccinylase [Marinihelvus fidelis]KAA9133557.1 succinyl-diaminopimelate desuccinylase [Marinihelvus fidelis]